VRCAARNPTAWLNLSECIYAQAHQVRRGRYINALTADQQAYCGKLYMEQLPVVLRATELDTLYYPAWLTLTKTAASVGYEELADAAFWKAFRLAPRASDVIWWGLELYQPKWLGDRDKLKKVATAAAPAANGWDSWSRVQIAAKIYCVGFPELADPILSTAQERAACKNAVAARRRREQ
jgi:hypothetical protein